MDGKEFFKNNDTIEVLRENGNKRLIKRIFNRQGNKEPIVDYCIQTKFYVCGNERWINECYNKSKVKVERRFLGL